MNTDETRKQVGALIHPGMTATINGREVKREAFRFVIDERLTVYAVEDAVVACCPDYEAAS